MSKKEPMPEHLVLHYVDKAKDGNDEALSVLYQQFTSLFKSASTYRLLPGVTKEDMMQEHWFDLREAVQNFDKSKGAKFATWLCYTLYHNAGKRRSWYIRDKRKVVFAPMSSWDEPLKEDATYTLEDVVECDISNSAYENSLELSALSCLTRIEYIIVTLIQEGYTLQETANLLKIDLNYLHFIRRNIRAKVENSDII